MPPLAPSTVSLSVALSLLAGLANILGGVLLVHRSPSARSLRLLLAGYCGAHLHEHTVVPRLHFVAVAVACPTSSS